MAVAEKGTAAWALVNLAAVFALAGVLFPPRPGAAALPLPPAPGQGAMEDIPSPSPSPAAGQTLRLLLPDGQVTAVGLEDYVCAVVTGEMPASFEPAALEAQAVAARTYALRRAESSAHAKDNAQVCADSACCMAYSPQDPAGWGENADAYRAKIRAAVDATAGEVLTQDGALIDAVFHASSAGATFPAQAVWGGAEPYLVSVSTPETEETVPGLRQEQSFSDAELEARLGSAEIGAVTYGDWGGVSAVQVGEKSLSGQEVRQKLGLRSTRFSVARRDGQTVFTTLGYGHGVGMSQQGANLMAKGGATYQEILAHYYPGSTLEKSHAEG